MARNYASNPTDIWRDDAFRALPCEAQRLLLLLNSQEDISAAGTLPLTLRRWANLGADTNTDDIERALLCLQAAGLVVVDRDTEELLVVPFVRWDNGFGNKNRKPLIMRAAQSVTSAAVGWALTQEFKALGLPLDGLPDGPPEPPSDGPTDALWDAPTEAPPDGPADGGGRIGGVVVGTEGDTGDNPQPATRNPGASRPRRLRSAEDPPRFGEFWAAYPRREDKGHARRAWPAAVARAGGEERVIAAAAGFAARCQRQQTQSKYIPLPSTWLNGDRWDDQEAAAPERPEWHQ